MKRMMLTIALLVVAGCAGVQDESPVLSRSPESSAAPIDPTWSAPTTVSELAGTWITADGDAEFVYRFDLDGTYRFAAVLAYGTPHGTVTISTGEIGTAEVAASSLTLRPRSVVQSKDNPAFPAENYTDRPGPTEPRTVDCAIAGSGQQLRIVGTDQVEQIFDRQPG